MALFLGVQAGEVLGRAFVLGVGFTGAALGIFVGGPLGVVAGGAAASLSTDFLVRSCHALADTQPQYLKGVLDGHVRLLFVRALRDGVLACVQAYKEQTYPDAAMASMKEHVAALTCLAKLRKELKRHFRQLEAGAAQSKKALGGIGLTDRDLSGLVLEPAAVDADTVADSRG